VGAHDRERADELSPRLHGITLRTLSTTRFRSGRVEALASRSMKRHRAARD
jgi:hypothetical protein